MAEFGAGPELAAQCPTAPIPDGWRNWTDADGPVPDALAKRAKAAADDQNRSLGSTESYPLSGVTALIRIEPRVWGRDAQGNLVEGCWRVGGIFLPSGAPAGAGIVPPSSSSLAKTVSILTIVSLTIGTTATLYSLSRA